MFAKQRQFLWKTALLAVTTLALIPILLYKSELAAVIYVVFLLVVHVAGLAVFLIGVRREDIAPSRRGLWLRLAGIAAAVLLLGLAAEGLRNEIRSAVFWASLFAIWGLHTAALSLLHIRGRPVADACPFV